MGRADGPRRPGKGLCFGLPQDIAKLKDEMRAADHQAFSKQTPANMIGLIKRRLLGIGYRYRTERLHSFLAACRTFLWDSWRSRSGKPTMP